MYSERLQFNLLQLQNVSNIWRKNAFNQLYQNATKLCSLTEEKSLTEALDVFREPLDFTLPV